MKNWFLSLTLRERAMVQVAAALFVIFMFYLFIWEPISDTYQTNKKNVATSAETLEWMKSAAREVKQLNGGNVLQGSSATKQGKQFVLGVIDRTVRNAGLATVMKRVQPEGNNGVRVWFESAMFDELMKWLATIESEHGLLVNEINVEQTESPGLVNVRVYLDLL